MCHAICPFTCIDRKLEVCLFVVVLQKGHCLMTRIQSVTIIKVHVNAILYHRCVLITIMVHNNWWRGTAQRLVNARGPSLHHFGSGVLHCREIYTGTTLFHRRDIIIVFVAMDTNKGLTAIVIGSIIVVKASWRQPTLCIVRLLTLIIIQSLWWGVASCCWAI